MSRPFSYSDENFTVIGNVLFIHIRFDKNGNDGDRLCEIPPAIFDRLLFYSNNGSTCDGTLGETSGNAKVSVIKDKNKFYLILKSFIGEFPNRYIFSIFMLKDA